MRTLLIYAAWGLGIALLIGFCEWRDSVVKIECLHAGKPPLECKAL